jgi:hypothetical protein
LQKKTKKGKKKEIEDKRAKKTLELGTIVIEQLSEFLKNMLKHNLM